MDLLNTHENFDYTPNLALLFGVCKPKHTMFVGLHSCI